MQALAAALATALDYSPISLPKLAGDFVARESKPGGRVEGEDPAGAAVAAEALFLEELSTHVRLAVATAGGGGGAAARWAVWRHIYGSFSVWLDEFEGEDSSLLPQREAYVQAELRLPLAATVASAGASGGGGGPLSEGAVDALVAKALSGLREVVGKDGKLAGKKSMYIRLGCRGDWPNLAEPGWVPPGDAAPQVTVEGGAAGVGA